AGALPGTGQERLGVVGVVGEVDRHRGSRLHGAVARRLAHPGVAQQLLQRPDARLLAPLLLLGGVVAAVLTQVALFPTGVDLRREYRTVRDQLVELCPEPVVPLLGEPGDRTLATS